MMSKKSLSLAWWLGTLVVIIGWIFTHWPVEQKTSFPQLANEFGLLISERAKHLSNINENIATIIKKYDETTLARALWSDLEIEALAKNTFHIQVFDNDSLIFWNTTTMEIFPDDYKSSLGWINTSTGNYIYTSQKLNAIKIVVAEPVFLKFPIQNALIHQGFVGEFHKYNDKIQIISTIGAKNGDLPVTLGDDVIYLRSVENQISTGNDNIVLLDVQMSLLLIILLIIGHKTFKLRIQWYGLSPWFIFQLILVCIIFIIALWFRKIQLSITKEYTDFLPIKQLPLFTSLLYLLITNYFAKSISDSKNHFSNQLVLSLKVVLFLFLNAFLAEFLLSISFQQSESIVALNILKGIDWQDMLIMLTTFIVLSGLITSLYKFLNNDFYSLKFNLLKIITSALLLLTVNVIWFIDGEMFNAPVFVTSVIILISSIEIFKKQQIKPQRILFACWFLVSFGAAVLWSVQTQNKADEEQMLTAKKLSADKDPMLEFTFNEIKNSIAEDSILIGQVFIEDADDQLINAYLRTNYFLGYLARFETEVTSCHEGQHLLLQPENRTEDCIEYFRSLVAAKGNSLEPGGIYVIDNNLLGIHYVGHIALFNPEKPDGEQVNLFIEFFYKYIPEGTGYPELLIDEAKGLGPDLNKYSFASYRDGVLYYKFGTYFFPLRLEQIAAPEEGFFNVDGYRHAILKYDDKTLIISRKNKNWAETMAPFSFFLLFNGLLVIFIQWIYQGFPDIRKTFATFRTRLQLLLSTALLTSFTLIGLVSTLFLSEIYRKKNDDFLTEKTQSIIVELEHKLKDLPIESFELESYLNQILLKFSLVFFTDINLYDINGSLLATSRPEIFEMGLAGRRMHPGAFKALRLQNRLYLQQYEVIGKARFISSYAPFKNNRGEAVAFVNLPYFAKESEMQREVGSMALSYINLFLLLSGISLLFALIVSQRLTRPLRMIQQKMSRVQLGHVNEKIHYQRFDEIGELVNQYNTLLDQLAASADLLARSERETAWREMARQVAHEIKNPLTPMRLSVQYLLKAWSDQDPDIEQKIKSISQTLINQIDTLSSIASAFSDFALMPQPNPAMLDLSEILHKVVHLFDHHENITFKIEINALGPTMVIADQQHINRVLVNLIKNSIQALSQKPNGLITIRLHEKEKVYEVEVEDNGKGMTEEEVRKVFTPNFTTKSSGMGMGLSIVRNLVQQAGGSVRFSTVPGEGTSFIVELPKANENTKPDQT